MSDEELAKTINSVKIMVNEGMPNSEGIINLLLSEVVKRKNTTNRDLIEFQDLIVNSFIKASNNEKQQ